MSIIVEKRIAFDKNMIQGLKSEKLNVYKESPYKTLITRGLLIECLGNLTKQCQKYQKKLEASGTTKESYTSSLFRKIQIFPLAKYEAMDLIRMELFDNVHIKMLHNFFKFESFASSEQSLDIFDHEDSQDQVKRWANGKFIDEDYHLANKYLNGLDSKKVELTKSTTTLNYNIVINETKIRPHSYRMTHYIEKIIQDTFINPEQITESRNKIIHKMKTKSLCEFAPYTAYVYTIDNLFHNLFLPKWIDNNSSKPASNWIDFNYIYYFPFIDHIISNDSGFKNCVETIFSSSSMPQDFFRCWSN